MRTGSSRMQCRNAVTGPSNFAVMLNVMIALQTVRLKFQLNNTVHLQ